jgi:hypothetical protein
MFFFYFILNKCNCNISDGFYVKNSICLSCFKDCKTCKGNLYN